MSAPYADLDTVLEGYICECCGSPIVDANPWCPLCQHVRYEELQEEDDNA